MDPATKTAALRVLDANFNRAAEGLRVLEDFVRLVLEDAHLSRLMKELRHELAEHRQAVGHERLLRARNTAGDVGTEIGVPTEYDRNSVPALLTANSQRVEQSLRCLEEYAKLVMPEQVTHLEQLRYRFYTLSRAITNTHSNRQRLAESRLYVLLPGSPTIESLLERVTPLVEAGVDVLQLRDKVSDDRHLFSQAQVIRAQTASTKTLFVMNDRPDIALLSHADGVHVGQEEIPVGELRSLVGDEMLIGVSTHSIEQARQAVLDGADYLGCGPTFASSTKTFSEFPGLPFLREVQAEIQLPAFAIGGINAERLSDVLATGFQRVAVSAAVTAAANPAGAARELRIRLDD